MDRRRHGGVRDVTGNPRADGGPGDRLPRSGRGGAVRAEVPRPDRSIDCGSADEGGRIMSAARAIRIGAGVAAAVLVALSAQLPLWTMTMRAPQYPGGLRLYAYGTG